MKQAIDGYTAWHPKEGFFTIQSDVSSIAIFESKYDARWTKCPYKGKCCFNIKDGWKVRPIKLVFLDVGEG